MYVRAANQIRPSVHPLASSPPCPSLSWGPFSGMAVSPAPVPTPTDIPSELAYGDRARGKFITAGAVLVFTLEILKVDPGHGDL